MNYEARVMAMRKLDARERLVAGRGGRQGADGVVSEESSDKHPERVCGVLTCAAGVWKSRNASVSTKNLTTDYVNGAGRSLSGASDGYGLCSLCCEVSGKTSSIWIKDR